MTTDPSAYFDLIVHHETALWNAVDHRLREAGAAVRLGRLEVLRTIRDLQGAGRVQDLAEHLGTTVGAASRLVDRLEADALVARRPHPTDRRSSRLELSGEGATALASSEAAFRSSLESVLSRVAPADLEALVAAVTRVDDILTDAAKGSSE